MSKGLKEARGFSKWISEGEETVGPNVLDIVPRPARRPVWLAMAPFKVSALATIGQ